MSLLIKKILEKVKNIDKVKADKMDITTGVEFKTGRIIDGKEEYGKRIDCGTLPAESQLKYKSTGLSNINFIRLEGIIQSSTLATNIPFEYPGQPTITHYYSLSNNQIIIKVVDDASKYTAIETVYYTKN